MDNVIKMQPKWIKPTTTRFVNKDLETIMVRPGRVK